MSVEPKPHGYYREGSAPGSLRWVETFEDGVAFEYTQASWSAPVYVRKMTAEELTAWRTTSSGSK